MSEEKELRCVFGVEVDFDNEAEDLGRVFFLGGIYW